MELGILSFLGMVTNLCRLLKRRFLSTPSSTMFIILRFHSHRGPTAALRRPLQRSSLLAVHRPLFLTLHHRCACSPAARQCTPRTGRFDPGLLLCTPRVPLRCQTGLPLVGCDSSTRTDGLEHREAQYSHLCP
jgi:hypothetical protein